MTNPGAASRTLVLLRHGKSDYPGGVTDHGRPLSERGRREGALAGTWIGGNVPPLDGVFCSSAVRARQTWEALGLAAPVVFEDAIYDASAGEILELVVSADPQLSTILVIGHAPGLPSLAMALAGDGSNPHAMEQLGTKFPTSAIAVLFVAGPWAELDAGEATLVDLHIPRA